MRTYFTLILPIFLALSYCQIIPVTPSTPQNPTANCLVFQSGQCTACPNNYNLYQQICYRNITGCIKYSLNSSNSEICIECDPAISVPDNKGGCTLTVPAASNMYLDVGLKSGYLS